MSDTLTKEQRAAAWARCEAAEPPPYTYGQVPRDEEPDTWLIGAGGVIFCRVVGRPGHPAEPTAALFAHARTDQLAALNTIDKLEAENARLRGLLVTIRDSCHIETKSHLSYGPGRFLQDIDEVLSADPSDALRIEKHLRETLHRIATYPPLTAEEMAAIALAALGYDPAKARAALEDRP